ALPLVPLDARCQVTREASLVPDWRIAGEHAHQVKASDGHRPGRDNLQVVGIGQRNSFDPSRAASVGELQPSEGAHAAPRYWEALHPTVRPGVAERAGRIRSVTAAAAA